MSKIFIYSDLHTEYYPSKFWYDENNNLPFKVEDNSTIVLAGDIGNIDTIPLLFDKINKFYQNVKIIYVLGNHEFYDNVYEKALKKYKDICKEFDNVYLLENGTLVDDENKRVFIGATLWSNLELGGNVFASSNFSETFVSDYSVIRTNTEIYYDVEERIKPNFTINLFKKSSDFIKNELNNHNYKDNKKKVVTHFLPLKDVVHKQYTNMIETAYWASNIPNIVKDSDVWIYGHSHNNVNKKVKFDNGKEVVLIANQQGYQNFDSNKKEIHDFIECFYIE